MTSTAQCPPTFFHFLSLSLSKPHFLPKHLEITKTKDESPPPHPPARTYQPTPHRVYLSIQWVWTAGGGSGWAALSLRLYHTASQPGAIEVLCLHNGVTNRCPFSEESVFWKKRESERRKESFRGSGNHYVRRLEYVKFIQVSSLKSPIPLFSSFDCLAD